MPVAIALTIVGVIHLHLGDERLPTQFRRVQFVTEVEIKIGA